MCHIHEKILNIFQTEQAEFQPQKKIFFRINTSVGENLKPVEQSQFGSSLLLWVKWIQIIYCKRYRVKYVQ